ncbi:MAG: hypothetical protein IPJ27_00145 [Candidatus Accumulibacter sp.]|uniref:Uncharacterized protein n=1 Tax=Candidatus Accumulibacter proximus TaxID=2954385 RepID=A0A935PTY6_9PROT|nr:hypothetical protein [Candidatus Accumulibacter proximus]
MSLKLSHLLNACPGPAAGAEQGRTSTICALIEGEAHARKTAVLRRVGLARFPVVKTLDLFEWSWPTKINRPQIQNLFRRASSRTRARIFIANVGLGKVISIALAHTAPARLLGVVRPPSISSLALRRPGAGRP